MTRVGHRTGRRVERTLGAVTSWRYPRLYGALRKPARGGAADSQRFAVDSRLTAKALGVVVMGSIGGARWARRLRVSWHCLLVVAFAATGLAAPATAQSAAKGGGPKPDPATSMSDPRSGAALNRDAARHAQPAPSAVYPADPRT